MTFIESLYPWTPVSRMYGTFSSKRGYTVYPAPAGEQLPDSTLAYLLLRSVHGKDWRRDLASVCNVPASTPWFSLGLLLGPDSPSCLFRVCVLLS